MEVPVWLVPDRRKLPGIRGGKRRSSDRRRSLRFIVQLPIKIKAQDSEKGTSISIKGESVNINESGVDVALERPLNDLRVFYLTMVSKLSALNKDIPVELVWRASNIRKRKFLYGFKFLKLDREQLISLREFLYLNDNFVIGQANYIVKLITDPAIERKVRRFFIKDIKNYLEELASLEKEIYQKGPTDIGQVKLSRLNGEILKKGEGLEETISNSIVLREIKRRFRILVGGFAYQSFIVKRATDKPLGYPGDYELLEAIYDNRLLSERMGLYFDKSFLDNNYAVAVRNRKDKMKVILSEFINSSALSIVKILNLACGSCREIKELLSGPVLRKNRIVFECVDQDENALEFAKGALGKQLGNIDIKFYRENILEMLDKPSYYDGLIGKQDLIYSIGLADYLPDRILKRLIFFCFKLLRPGGRLIITHKDIDKYKPLEPDWFCNWTFIPRNREKLANLIRDSGIEDFSVAIERDGSQIIIFLIITRS